MRYIINKIKKTPKQVKPKQRTTKYQNNNVKVPTEPKNRYKIIKQIAASPKNISANVPVVEDAILVFWIHFATLYLYFVIIFFV